jgi:hypothetical protein
MKKLCKLLTIIAIGAVITGGVFAQEDGGTGGAAADTGKVFFNAGIGAGFSVGRARSVGGSIRRGGSYRKLPVPPQGI